jgi:hypothetical protein
MSVVTDKIGNSLHYGPGRRVSIKRDKQDYTVAFQPEDLVIFRHEDANALKKVCRSLRWEIVNDASSMTKTLQPDARAVRR